MIKNPNKFLIHHRLYLLQDDCIYAHLISELSSSELQRHGRRGPDGCCVLRVKFDAPQCHHQRVLIYKGLDCLLAGCFCHGHS